MKKEPIAIVGMSCRFPNGANNPDAFWDILASNYEASVSQVDNRWNTDYYFHPDRNIHGKSYTKSAHLIDDVYGFDADFFGVSPREAAQMDPQQRHLLELVWEALEDGHQIPQDISGTDCAVYVGISSTDYATSRHNDPCAADVHFMTGNTLSIAANRISYFYDLHGPSMAIDTACSSSLVAAHQACQSIWNGESATALVGSMHLMFSPFPFIGFSKASMLSPDSECRVFDDSANGYVRSEGGAVLFLKPLSDAERDNDPIHAVILASGVNTDGYKNTLTVPDTNAQISLIESVYNDAQVAPDDICYVEAHGTGTPVGDPIESESIGTAIGKKRESDKPILIGSVKSNLGHLEPASGMAGLFKIILSTKHRKIPATIGINKENSNIDFKNLNIDVTKHNRSLEECVEPIIMGVNSFGFGGSNAHLLIQEYKQDDAIDSEPTSLCPPLFLYANNQDALQQKVKQSHDFLASNPTRSEIYDYLGTSAKHRQQLKFGLATTTTDYDLLKQHLNDYLSGDKENIVEETRTQENAKLAFVFSGNGSQWQGMGKQLLSEPVFLEIITQIDKLFSVENDWSIIEELKLDQNCSNLDKTEYAQPLLFSIQIGLFHLLEYYGVKPQAITGHSVGEVAAAYAADILSLEDAIQVISARSQLQGKTKGCGKMLAARISVSDAEPFITKYLNKVEIAAINSPRSITLTGDETCLHKISQELEAKNIFCRMLDLDYAFHSNRMDAISSEISNELENLETLTSTIDFYSTVTGNKTDGSNMYGNYWSDNIRQAVLFESAIQKMINDDCNLFVEIGPHPVLLSYIHEYAQHNSTSIKTFTTLKRHHSDENKLVHETVLRTHLLGATSDHSRYFTNQFNRVSLSPYPWAKQECFLERTQESSNYQPQEKLLGWKINNVDGIWENQIDIHLYDYLADHVIDDTYVFPATGYVEIALEASSIYLEEEQQEISELEIRSPLIFNEGSLKIVQLVLDKKTKRFEIKSRTNMSDEDWVLNAKGKIKTAKKELNHLNIGKFDEIFTEKSYNSKKLYDFASSIGLSFGKTFQGLGQTERKGNKIYSKINTPGNVQKSSYEYILHPAILDSCFHSLLNVFIDIDSHEKSSFVPVRLGNISAKNTRQSVTYCLTELHRVTPTLINASFTLYDENQEVIAFLSNCDFKKLKLRKTETLVPEKYIYTEVLNNLINPEITSNAPDSAYLSTYTKKILTESSISNKLLKYEAEILPLCDALASTLANILFNNSPLCDGKFTIEDFLHDSNISHNQYEYIHALLNILHEDQKAEFKDDYWKILEQPEQNEAIAIWRTLLADHPDFYRELLLTSKAGFNLEKLLKTGIEEQSVLNVSDSLISTQNYVTNIYSDILCQIILDIAERWPGHIRRLKIAEIGHGEENLVNILLHKLPKYYCDYTSILISTDDSYNLQLKSKSHSNYNVVTVDGNDIDQYFTKGEFDVLIFNNSFLTENSSTLLEHTKYLLSTSGVFFVFNEIVDRLTLLNNGFNPHWFSRRITDDLHSSSISKLLPALERHGFKDISTLTSDIEQHDYYEIISAHNYQKEIEKGENYYNSLCVIFSDDNGDSIELGKTLKAHFKTNDFQVLHASLGENYRVQAENHYICDLNNTSHLEQLIEDNGIQAYKTIHYIYLVNFDMSEISDNQDIIDQQLKYCMPLLSITKTVSNIKTPAKPFFWLITSGAFSFNQNLNPDEKHIQPSQGSVWGLGKTLKNEVLNVIWKQVDIQDEKSYHNIASHITNEIKYTDAEDEIAIRNDSRYALRLQKLSDTKDTNKIKASWTEKITKNKHYQLKFTQTGSPEYLYWHENDSVVLNKTQVEVKVISAGLNFRDIMYLSGFLPDEMLSDGFAGANLGLECAGIITRVGEDVDNYSIGDEVICFASSCFASHVVTDQLAIGHKPSNWSFDEAVTIPTTFFTTYYSLEYLAKIKANESILIHGAAGGVGLAAIQYAKHCGATVFATAGTEQKRQFLKLLGADYVFDSRQLSFANEIMEITNHEGVDIILNSLAGEAIETNLELLKPFGRFLELGKRDFYENTQIAIKPFRNNISYFAVDADQLMAKQPEVSNQIFTQVLDMFQKGLFRPIPYTVFSAQEIKSAFRFMQQSHHIGKVVVSFHDQVNVEKKHEKQSEPLQLQERASYLITGGCGGLGLETAKWMVRHGAKNIYLLGRSTNTPENVKEFIQEQSKKGISVNTLQCDICDLTKLKEIISNINSTGHPLKGILHAAMVLDDCLTNDLDQEKMEKVMKPKIQGAWNLHNLTIDSPLDFFIMYSSIATYIGNLGQSNYVAANMFLDSLCQYRLSLGLTAKCVSLDAILDVGVLSRDEKLKDILVNKRGISGITSEQALQAIFDNTDTPMTYMLGKPNFHLMRKSLNILNSPTYSQLLAESEETGSIQDESYKEVIYKLSEDDAHVFIVDVLVNELSMIMHLDKKQLDIETPIQNYGIDSLMATELLSTIETKFETNIPITTLVDNSTIDSISKRIYISTLQQSGTDSNNEVATLSDQVTLLAKQHGVTANEEDVAEFISDKKNTK